MIGKAEPGSGASSNRAGVIHTDKDGAPIGISLVDMTKMTLTSVL